MKPKTDLQKAKEIFILSIVNIFCHIGWIIGCVIWFDWKLLILFYAFQLLENINKKIGGQK